jgi:hypothetical protein
VKLENIGRIAAATSATGQVSHHGCGLFMRALNHVDLERGHEPRRLRRWRIRPVRLAQCPAGGPVASPVLGPAPVALPIVPEIPSLAGVYELTAARFGASDGARGNLRRPALAELAMVGAVAAFGSAAAFEVALPLVGVPAGVATAGGVAGEAGAACAAGSEAGARASGHVSIIPSPASWAAIRGRQTGRLGPHSQGWRYASRRVAPQRAARQARGHRAVHRPGARRVRRIATESPAAESDGPPPESWGGPFNCFDVDQGDPVPNRSAAHLSI